MTDPSVFDLAPRAAAEELLRRGDAAGALGQLAALSGEGAEGIDRYMAEYRAHLMLDDRGAAARALRSTGEAGADPETVQAGYRDLKSGDIPAEDEIALLEWLSVHRADYHQRLRLVRLRIKAQDFAAAEADARSAVAMDPGHPRGHQLLYVAVLRSGDPDRVTGVIEGALDSATGDPRFPALQMTLAGLEPEVRARLVERLEARWPGRTGNGAGGDLEIGGDGRTNPERQAYALALEGETGRALDLADSFRESYEARNATARMRRIRQVIKAIPVPAARGRALIEDDGGEVIRSEPSQSGVTLLAFTDLAHQLNYPLPVIDAFCAAAGAASLFVRDHGYRLFIGGIATLAPDRAGTLDALRREIAALGTRRLVVMGLSSGAFSALSYGRELDADAIHGVATPTSIGRFLTGADSRSRALIGRLARSFAPAELDLARILPRLPGRAPIELHYGEGSEVDRAHAADLAHLPGVTLDPLRGYVHHQMMPELIARGRFQDWLRG